MAGILARKAEASTGVPGGGFRELDSVGPAHLPDVRRRRRIFSGPKRQLPPARWPAGAEVGSLGWTGCVRPSFATVPQTAQA